MPQNVPRLPPCQSQDDTFSIHFVRLDNTLSPRTCDCPADQGEELDFHPCAGGSQTREQLSRVGCLVSAPGTYWGEDKKGSHLWAGDGGRRRNEAGDPA